MKDTRIIISVLGADTTGIVAAVSKIAAEHNANIADITQTIVDGLFTMTMVVSIDEEKSTFDDLRTALLDLQETLGVQIIVQKEEVFNFMHRL